jgi:hypothetical protein
MEYASPTACVTYWSMFETNWRSNSQAESVNARPSLSPFCADTYRWPPETAWLSIRARHSQHELLIQRSAPAFAAGSIQQSQNALRAVRLDDPTSTERKLQVPIVDQAQRLSAIRFRGQLASEMTTDSSKKDIAPLEWRELWTYLGGEVNASVRVDSVHSSFHLVSRRTGCLRLD